MSNQKKQKFNTIALKTTVFVVIGAFLFNGGGGYYIEPSWAKDENLKPIVRQDTKRAREGLAAYFAGLLSMKDLNAYLTGERAVEPDYYRELQSKVARKELQRYFSGEQVKTDIALAVPTGTASYVELNRTPLFESRTSPALKEEEEEFIRQLENKLNPKGVIGDASLSGIIRGNYTASNWQRQIAYHLKDAGRALGFKFNDTALQHIFYRRILEVVGKHLPEFTEADERRIDEYEQKHHTSDSVAVRVRAEETIRILEEKDFYRHLDKIYTMLEIFRLATTPLSFIKGDSELAKAIRKIKAREIVYFDADVYLRYRVDECERKMFGPLFRHYDRKVADLFEAIMNIRNSIAFQDTSEDELRKTYAVLEVFRLLSRYAAYCERDIRLATLLKEGDLDGAKRHLDREVEECKKVLRPIVIRKFPLMVYRGTSDTAIDSWLFSTEVKVDITSREQRKMLAEVNEDFKAANLVFEKYDALREHLFYAYALVTAHEERTKDHLSLFIANHRQVLPVAESGGSEEFVGIGKIYRDLQRYRALTNHFVEAFDLANDLLLPEEGIISFESTRDALVSCGFYRDSIQSDAEPRESTSPVSAQLDVDSPVVIKGTKGLETAVIETDGEGRMAQYRDSRIELDPLEDMRGLPATLEYQEESLFAQTEVESTVAMLETIKDAKLHVGKTYVIGYDVSRLSRSQVRAIAKFVELIRTKLPESIVRQRQYSDGTGPLISMICSGENFESSSFVYTPLPEGDLLQNYFFPLGTAISGAFAAVHLRDGLSRDELLYDYKPLVDYVQAQYSAIYSGRKSFDFDLTRDDPEIILNAMKHMRLYDLPKADTFNVPQYHKSLLEALSAA